MKQMDYLENDGETGASSMRGASSFHSSSEKNDSPLIRALEEHISKYYPTEKPAPEEGNS